MRIVTPFKKERKIVTQYNDAQKIITLL